MESLICPSRLTPTALLSHGFTNSNRCPLIPFHVTRFGVQLHRRPFFICSNKSSLVDFQDYTRPRRLLPATEPKLFVDESLKRIISSFQLDGSQSLYKVLLTTSSIYGSGLSDLNDGLLLCIIDENGDSLLQRVPAILCQDHIVQFQTGLTDEFIFWGPKLSRIRAMWIGPESGKWRLAGASLTITSACKHQTEEGSEDENMYCSITYNFDVEDVLLGERSDMTMVELWPSLVTEYSRAHSLSFVDINAKQSESVAEKGKRKEETMKAYADLKYSLLLYDAVLVFAGTSISSFTAGENAALAFLTGGIGGFLYLLLLQKSVDELPAPESVVANKASNGGLRGPLLVLAFTFGVAALVTRRNTLGIEAALTPRDIVVGMMGFLSCKVSVVLAAIKPISIDLKDRND